MTSMEGLDPDSLPIGGLRVCESGGYRGSSHHMVTIDIACNTCREEMWIIKSIKSTKMVCQSFYHSQELLEAEVPRRSAVVVTHGP